MLLTEEKLYSGVGFIPEIENLDEVLSWNPKQEWVMEHPQIKGYKYLPIAKVEFLLSRLFYNFSLQISNSYETKTGCLVVVKLQVESLPKTKNFDGIGAIQYSNECSPTMAFPMAKTLAFKDATDHLGTIFGKDLNRKDVVIIPKKTLSEIESEFLESTKLKVSKVIGLEGLELLWNETKEFIPNTILNNVKALFTSKKYDLQKQC